MRSGINAIESALKSNPSGGGARTTTGRYLNYFILGDGESKVVRFLTDMDEVTVVKFYEFIKDRNGKFQNFIVAPDFYADDPTWRGEDWVRKFGGKTTDYTTKELVDPKPRERIVGLAIEREEVPVDSSGRRILRTQDKITEFEGKDGKTYAARNFLVVKQHKNFWQMLTNYYHEFGTICDRDYKISRFGTGADIVYSIIPKNPDEGWDYDGTSLAALQASYGYGTGKDMDGNELTQDSEDRFLYCSQTLQQWMENQASEDRARVALVGDNEAVTESRPVPGWAADSSDEPQAAPALASAGADVSSLRARLERHR